jgi:hypothetical protein
MAKVHLKFRCYRCKQLLGASSRRAGTVISCPRCRTELEVPRPDKPATSAAIAVADSPSRRSSRGTRSSAAVRGTSAAVSSFIEEISAAIPDELAAMRPEDIRVEAEFANRFVRTREPVVPVLPARVEVPPEPESQSVEALQITQAAHPVQMPRRVETRPLAQAAHPVQMPRRVETRPHAPMLPDSPLIAAGRGQPTKLIDASLPAIQVDSPSILPPGRDIRPVSEVVLQRATVLAWSLLVLMAMPMAFIAGLLLGHFVWK